MYNIILNCVLFHMNTKLINSFCCQPSLVPSFSPFKMFMITYTSHIAGQVCPYKYRREVFAIKFIGLGPLLQILCCPAGKEANPSYLSALIHSLTHLRNTFGRSESVCTEPLLCVFVWNVVVREEKRFGSVPNQQSKTKQITQ
jgi:hypothetical protein